MSNLTHLRRRLSRGRPARSFKTVWSGKPLRRGGPPYRPATVVAGGGAALAAFAGGVWWIRTHPAPLPYGQRVFVQIPHPLLTRRRLLGLLRPEPGAALLEVGPGTGLYTRALADGVGAAGTLTVLDAQLKMLEHTLATTRRRGLANVSATEGDARELPYADESFDAAVIVRTLGEVPDQERVLSELRRVLRPGGRLVVGEAADDPHFVTHGSLVAHAEAAGLTPEARAGAPFAYFALLRR